MIISAAQTIMLGESELAIGAGAEINQPWPRLAGLAALGGALWQLGDNRLYVGNPDDPFEHIHMGVTAENVAERYGITRECRTNYRFRANSARLLPSRTVD